jgi:hypothetical protein
MKIELEGGHNPAQKSSKQEEDAGSEKTQEEITVLNEVPEEMENRIPLDRVQAEQLHGDPVAERGK